jgi:hypothetical protein
MPITSWAAAGEVRLPRRHRGQRVAQRVVDEHRQVVDLAAGRSDLADVARDRPAVEILLGVVAIDGGPGAPGLVSLAGLAVERGVGLLQPQHLGRHVGGEGAIRGGAVVARQAVGADLVLHLHHDHGALRLVHLLQVGHQRDEGALVRRQGLGTEGRQAVARLALRIEHAREAGVVQLDPGRRVLRAGVLPGREPQQRDPHAAFARLREQGVHEGEIETALDGLDLLPGHRHDDGVGLGIGHRRPHLLERLDRVARVVHLRAQHQEGLAVDQQRMTPVALDQPRQLRRGGGAGEDGGQGRKRRQSGGADTVGGAGAGRHPGQSFP